jgi:CPA1 family monovalent cation:H+ antiporter
LPPLVFEAAFQLPWKPLRRDLPVILLLATLGVILAAALTAAGMHYIAGWTWMAALVFGVLIAATDPVSVIATFKESGVRGRLRLLVEAESLFNDGTAAVAFGIVVALALGQSYSAFDLTRTLVITAGGGIVCGAAVAGAVLLLAGPAMDHLVELAFTTVAAYGSFLLAEHFQMSGILATVTIAIMLGNLWSSRSDHRQRPRSRGSLLGIRRFRRELSGVLAARTPPRPTTLLTGMARRRGSYRHRPSLFKD